MEKADDFFKEHFGITADEYLEPVFAELDEHLHGTEARAEQRKKEEELESPAGQRDELRDAVSHIRRLFSATDEVNAATLAGIMQMHGADIGRNRLYDLMEKGGYVRRTSTGEYACTPKGLESGLRDAATDMWDKGKTPSGVGWRQPLISEKFAIAVTKKILGSMNQ